MKKTKRTIPLSHKNFKHNCIYEPTANPRIVAVRQQAEAIAKKIKKEGIQ
jgi:hypothetical protein